MRIITGDYRGRKLEAPYGRDIRPTSDKVKEALFSILMNDTYGRVFLDLFSGTGNLGLEALSRGASRCYFCDESRESIRIIRKNIEICGAEKGAVVIQGDFRKCLEKIDEKVDVILLDPPYEKGLYNIALERIDTLDLLSSQGIIIVEHNKGEDLPEKVGSLVKNREKRYGRTMLSIYERESS